MSLRSQTWYCLCGQTISQTAVRCVAARDAAAAAKCSTFAPAPPGSHGMRQHPGQNISIACYDTPLWPKIYVSHDMIHHSGQKYKERLHCYRDKAVLTFRSRVLYDTWYSLLLCLFAPPSIAVRLYSWLIMAHD